MKRQLLLGSALMLTLSAFPQQGFQQVKKQAQPMNMAAYLAQKYALQSNLKEASMVPTNPNKEEAPVTEANPVISGRLKSINAPGNWRIISGSMNIFGTLVSNSEPLQYNDELNTVSFVHRKSATYVTDVVYDTDPENSGSMVGIFTQNWGNKWDSTLLWRENTYWGRYPQGGIWNAPGDSNLGHAQVIGTGPTTSASNSWVGSFIGSKALDTMGGANNNNVMTTVGGATLFASNTPPYTSVGKKLDMPRNGFAVTNDGRVRSLGINIDAVSPNFSGPRGSAMLKGTYDVNNGIFNWSVDTIHPDVEKAPTSGDPHLLIEPNMTWSDDGKTGFIWFVGVRKHRPGMGDTLSNNGYQPIVYKTTDSGATWVELPRINFNNNPVMNPVMNHILGVSNDTTNTLAIPFFSPSEGADGVVDRNGRLHIITTVVGTFSSHPDSLGFTFQMTLPSDGQAYSFGHRPGLRPYIYDFTETPTGWNCTVIDSMSTEGPAASPGTNQNANGYNDNPWDADPNNQNAKVSVDGRLQASRSVDGKYIVATWAESDTANTTGGRKWNTIPNVKARLITVGVETGTVAGSLAVHANEINVTSPVGSAPPYTVHAQVAANATNHYISPKMAVISSTAATGVALALPITVSNSAPKRQLQPNRHWYLSANLNFDNVPSTQISWPEAYRATAPATVDAIAENSALEIPSVVYPNPANGAAFAKFSLEKNVAVDITVTNIVGQVVSTQRKDGLQGENTVTFNTSNFESGLYTVQIKAGDARSTQKIVVQH